MNGQHQQTRVSIYLFRHGNQPRVLEQRGISHLLLLFPEWRRGRMAARGEASSCTAWNASTKLDAQEVHCENEGLSIKVAQGEAYSPRRQIEDENAFSCAMPAAAVRADR